MADGGASVLFLVSRVDCTEDIANGMGMFIQTEMASEPEQNQRQKVVEPGIRYYDSTLE